MIGLKVLGWDLGGSDHLRDVEINPEQPFYLNMNFDIKFGEEPGSEFFIAGITNTAQLQKYQLQQLAHMVLIFDPVYPAVIAEKCIGFLEGLVFANMIEASSFLEKILQSEFQSSPTVTLHGILNDLN